MENETAMKKILPFLLLAIACNSSTESKISSAIKEIEQKDLSKNSSVESISIDSIDYTMSSEKDYWIYRKIIFNITELELNRLDRELVESYLRRNDTIKINQIKADREKRNAMGKKFDSLYLHSDTTKIFYEVKYHLSAKTDKDSYNSTETKFLYTKDLTEFKGE
jgi:hypothetical protein